MAKASAEAALTTIVTPIEECRQTHANTLTQLEDAERKAWLSLAGYKFLMFGYHAAQWVLLKRLLPAHVRNPFASLVRLAQEECKRRGWKGTKEDAHG